MLGDVRAIDREDALVWDGKRFGQERESARIYVHIARDAPLAAVLRRGPGRHTALLKWNLATDEVNLEQWVNARVYERRCDISPDGKHFLYFAAKFKAPLYSWTAISILPWFRACTIWNKGDCWGGGGHFDENGTIRLNHRPEPYYEGQDEFMIERGNLPRPWKEYIPFGERSGWGEDEPINTARLARSGWRTEQTPKNIRHTFEGQHSWVFDGSFVRAKNGPDDWLLYLIDDAGSERNGRWHLTECQISSEQSQVSRSFGRVDWADWHNGRLLFARNGCLWCLQELETGEPRLVVDLNPMRFENIRAPYGGAGRVGSKGWTSVD